MQKEIYAAEELGDMGTTLPSAPTSLAQYPKLCELRRKFPVLYRVEFQSAAKVETHLCRHAMKPANREKNQNQRCIPYDYNRVVLDTINGQPDTDYINASYVDSLLKPNAYIVTQGPIETTVTEFWRMVWQERASCIVMLTKTFDFIKVMCVQYWPANKDKDENYGGIGVSVLKEEELANFHIRTIKLYIKDDNGEIKEERTLLQFHYTEWHSHTCPFGNAVLEFRRRVRAVVGSTIKNESGPMVVHCNDGGGRSGVYLAVDANMELAEEEDTFDVFGYLKKLRQSRRGLIESLDQYKFVYDTLEEFVICGASWFPVSELSQRLKQKSVKNPITKMNEYQREYQQICKQTPRFTIGDCAGGHRADNREKNRDVLVVPPDNFRPYLTSFQGNSFTDYINAVFVDVRGYTKPREYIVTEWPLKHTGGEFWSLVYDYECAAVVILCVPPATSTNFPSFWPEGRHSKKYGPVFTIDHISHNHYTNIKTWVFRINKKIVSLTELMAGVKAPPKTVQLFQLTCWPMGQAVPTSTNSLVELMNMVERWRQRTDYGPVVVVSPDGRSRCGVYCAANACIEQVIQHGEVDIFQAVKTVRRHRPQLVENMNTNIATIWDELWFIEFGRGAALPLTPEEAPTDGEPIVPCAQGRIVVETTHPAAPHFATCSTYRRTIIDASNESPHLIGDFSIDSTSQLAATTIKTTTTITTTTTTTSSIISRGAVAKTFYHRELSIQPQSLATRPEDLQVTPWYTEESIVDSSIRVSCDHQQHSYPSSSFSYIDQQMPITSDHYSMIASSAESDIAMFKINSSAPRKACMDLTDAIALLDETCPNPDASRSVTPKTPRTPLNLHTRNKRARSKSSDNSSNYSNERLNDRSMIEDSTKERDKIRPFLRKIGISKTEDRPFFSKIAPRIGIGKPYLEKIGPSKAVEKPFLEKIGSSKTLDKFTFDALRELPRAMIRRTHTIVEPIKIEETCLSDTNSGDTNDSIFIVNEEVEPSHIDTDELFDVNQRSGKGTLCKMYSFETEDLDDTDSFPTTINCKPQRVSSLDDILSCESSSLPPLEDTPDINDELSNTKVQSNFYSADVAQLVKCRVTTSEEIVSSNIKCLTSPQNTSRLNSSQLRAKQQLTAVSATLVTSSHFTSRELLSENDNIINSPKKQSVSKLSLEQQIPPRNDLINTKNSYLIRNVDVSPRKFSRQKSEEQPDIKKRNKIFDEVLAIKKLEDRTASAEFIPSSKSRRQLFNDIVNKFSESDYSSSKARRQISEDILDKSDNHQRDSDKNNCYKSYNDRRGISSDNLRYTRETIVGSAPSTSSLRYQDMSLETLIATTTVNTTTCNNESDKFVSKEKSINKDHSNKASTNDDKTITNFVNQTEGITSTIQNKNINETLSKNSIKKSVLKKQDRMDYSNDREADVAGSLRKPMRKIFHQPSQETIDLLTELRIVKSLLKTPSEEGKDWELDCLKPARLPKKISLSDKEFCLSIDRENSIRRPIHLRMSETDIKMGYDKCGGGGGDKVIAIDEETFGPALFEKRCLSLDYADDVKPIKSEIRAISLTSAETALSSEENKLVLSDPLIVYDSKSCLSDVFVSPNDNNDDTHNANGTDNKTVRIVNVPTKSQNNHFLEVDIAIPIDETGTISPKRRIQIQGKTSDIYEMISPRSTPFRVKKRLGRISVEETMKQESFAIGKVTDGRSVVTQKKTKCFPL
ncbi:hypothetical protein PV326_011718 [Microctonus aethiopoides]|nr:hypothetical protein PV326_011718 [Microctonus aethiopoides]